MADLNVNSIANAAATGKPSFTFGLTDPTQVIVSAGRNTNQTIPNASDTTIVWDTEVIDNRSCYNTSTGEVTIPSDAAGTYLINVAVLWASGPWSTSHELNVKVYKNGMVQRRIGQVNPPSVTSNLNSIGSDVYSFAAGDVITLRAFQNAGGSRDIQGASSITFFSLVKIG